MLFATMLGAVGFAEAAAALPFDTYDYRVVADYDFCGISTSNKRYEYFAPSKYGYEFFAARVRIMADNPGMLLLSTEDNRGYLTMPPSSRNGADTLFISAKKFSDDDFKSEKSQMPIVWSSGAETGNFASVQLDTNFCWSGAVDFSSVPQDSDILINYGSVKSNRRVWIDRIIFARKRNHGFYLIIR